MNFGLIDLLPFFFLSLGAPYSPLFLSFKNKKAIEDWFSLIYDDIKKFGDNENILLNLLKFFEKLHWIEIESEKDLSFRIRLSKSKYTYEREFLLENLSKKSKISHENEKFYLKDIKS